MKRYEYHMSNFQTLLMIFICWSIVAWFGHQELIGAPLRGKYNLDPENAKYAYAIFCFIFGVLGFFGFVNLLENIFKPKKHIEISDTSITFPKDFIFIAKTIDFSDIILIKEKKSVILRHGKKGTFLKRGYFRKKDDFDEVVSILRHKVKAND